jgi:hypothetical protein
VCEIVCSKDFRKERERKGERERKREKRTDGPFFFFFFRSSLCKHSLWIPPLLYHESIQDETDEDLKERREKREEKKRRGLFLFTDLQHMQCFA